MLFGFLSSKFKAENKVIKIILCDFGADYQINAVSFKYQT